MLTGFFTERVVAALCISQWFLHYYKKPNNPLINFNRGSILLTDLRQGKAAYTLPSQIPHVGYTGNVVICCCCCCLSVLLAARLDSCYILLQMISVPFNFFLLFSTLLPDPNSPFINITEGVLLRVSYPFMLCMLIPSILFFKCFCRTIEFWRCTWRVSSMVWWRACSHFLVVCCHGVAGLSFCPSLNTDLSLYVSLKNILYLGFACLETG